MAKSRVAPLKPLSIPRLELQAAVMASRISVTLKSELEIPLNRLLFWSDSTCVLRWIRSDGIKYKQFVSHRVGEIQERTDVSSWHWVPSELNIADIATRPMLNEDYLKYPSEWFCGPEFLKQSEENWPKETIKDEISNEDEKLEEKKSFVGMIIREEGHLPDIRRFSKWLRLIRSTAWVIRFIKILKERIHGDIHCGGTLEVADMKQAEAFWIKHSQCESFPEEIDALTKKKSLNNKSHLKKLCPELTEDGYLIIGGRTNLAACLELRTKKPFILSPKNYFTQLLMRHYHEKYRHHGIETILTEIRQKFWIIGARSALKNIGNKCIECQKEKSNSKPPVMGQLPLERLTPCTRPFTYVGMDYFGPYLVTVGRHKEKRWGVLFTCLSVRAVHLEISHSLSSDAAIMAIRRFISRRGYPKTIWCDNGTNLRGADKELREAYEKLDRNSMTDFLSSKFIEFRFIPPGAPHMGGAWERLIGSVKRSLGAVVHGHSLKDETLLTLLAEVENILNARPLTNVSVDPNDSEALTPNHFLIGEGNALNSPVNLEISNTRKDWKKSQMLANCFWKRWVKEYLPSLTRRAKWTDNEFPLKPDDIVLIVDENSPRNNWLMGKILRVFPGPDGIVRVADVKTKKNIYRRPVTKLCRLDVEIAVNPEDMNVKKNKISSPGGECRR